MKNRNESLMLSKSPFLYQGWGSVGPGYMGLCLSQDPILRLFGWLAGGHTASLRGWRMCPPIRCFWKNCCVVAGVKRNFGVSFVETCCGSSDK